MTMNELKNPHAGDILKHEFIDEMGISQNTLAKSIAVPPKRIHAIVNGTRRITADTDLRLCQYFGLSEGYFLRLQNLHETWKAKQELQDTLKKIVPYRGVSSEIVPLHG